MNPPKENTAARFDVAELANPEYRVDSPFEVLRLARTMRDQRALVSVVAHSGTAFVTTIVDVDEKHRALVIDAPSDAVAHPPLDGASELLFATTLDRIKVLFVATALDTARNAERQWTVELPKTMARVQRRLHHRVQVPLSKSLHCKVPFPTEGEPRWLDAVVVDLSAGGVSLSGLPALPKQTHGLVFKDARLALPAYPPIVCDLEVCSVISSSDSTGRHRERLGCAFRRIGSQDSVAVERYVIALQREFRAKGI